MIVHVRNRQRAWRVASGALVEFLERVAQVIEPPEGRSSVVVCLVSDRRMSEWNRRFRGRRGPTDVLSFPAEPPPFGLGDDGSLGDIAISVPTAAAQAAAEGHGLDRELKVLALHGYLHLLGYDHETDDGTMLLLQNRVARRLLPEPSAPSAGEAS